MSGTSRSAPRRLLFPVSTVVVTVAILFRLPSVWSTNDVMPREEDKPEDTGVVDASTLPDSDDVISVTRWRHPMNSTGRRARRDSNPQRQPAAERVVVSGGTDATSLVRRLQDGILRLENTLRRRLEELRVDDANAVSKMAAVKATVERIQQQNDEQTSIDYRRHRRKDGGGARSRRNVDPDGRRNSSQPRNVTMSSSGQHDGSMRWWTHAAKVKRDTALSKSVSDILARINELDYRLAPKIGRRDDDDSERRAVAAIVARDSVDDQDVDADDDVRQKSSSLSERRHRTADSKSKTKQPSNIVKPKLKTKPTPTNDVRNSNQQIKPASAVVNVPKAGESIEKSSLVDALSDVIDRLNEARAISRRLPSTRPPAAAVLATQRLTTMLDSVEKTMSKATGAMSASSGPTPIAVRNRLGLIDIYLSSVERWLQRAKPVVPVADYTKLTQTVDRIQTMDPVKASNQDLSVPPGKDLVVDTGTNRMEPGKDVGKSADVRHRIMFVVMETDRVVMSMDGTPTRRLELKRDATDGAAVFNDEALDKIGATFQVRPEVAKQIGPVVDSLRRDKSGEGSRWTKWSPWSAADRCKSIPCADPAFTSRQRLCVSVSRLGSCAPGSDVETKACPADSRPACRQTPGDVFNAQSKPGPSACLRGNEMQSQLKSPQYDSTHYGPVAPTLVKFDCG